MQSLFSFFQKGAGSLISSNETSAPFRQSALLHLPPELLLSITDWLDKESIVVLSLCCKPLHTALHSNLDLSLKDVAQRTRFLRHLEIDHPEYLTCRACGWMFLWRARRASHYTCPRSSDHLSVYTRQSWPTYNHFDDHIFVGREVLDLVFRANNKGLQHGVPVSSFNIKGHDSHHISRTVEARLVHEQFLLAVCYVIDLQPGQEMVAQVQALNPALCLHWWKNICGGECQPIHEAVTSARCSGEPTTLQCPYCATDVRVSVEEGDISRSRIVVQVLRNFGNPDRRTPSTDQVFHLDPTRLDSRTLSARNLHTTFSSHHHASISHQEGPLGLRSWIERQLSIKRCLS